MHSSALLREIFFLVALRPNAGNGLLILEVSRTAKGKAVPLQDWRGPEGTRKSRFPDFITTAQDGCKFASLTHRPPLPTGNAPGNHFC